MDAADANDLRREPVMGGHVSGFLPGEFGHRPLSKRKVDLLVGLLCNSIIAADIPESERQNLIADVERLQAPR